MRVLVLMTLCLCLLLGGAALAGEASHKVLYNNYAGGKPIPLPSTLNPGLSLEEAYELQGAVVDLMIAAGDQVAGYKAGLTSEPAQKKFGAPGPASGVLTKSMQITSGVVDSAKYTRLMLEVEIGYRLGQDVTQPVTAQGVKALVSEVMPAVEVPDLNFATMKGLSFADIVAANVGARGFILGTPVKPDAVDVNAVTGKLVMDGQDLGPAVPGRAALGDQWKALAWTINNVLQSGATIQKGAVIITGSLGKMYPGKPGSYRAVYSGGLGEVAFAIKKSF